MLESGGDLADYEDMKDKLSPFERVTYTYRSDAELASLWKEEITLAELISTTPSIKHRSINPFNCRTCSYQDLCFAELRGDDAEFIKTQLLHHQNPRRREKQRGSQWHHRRLKKQRTSNSYSRY